MMPMWSGLWVLGVICRLRTATYIANCKKFEYKRLTSGHSDVTVFLDWTVDEVNQLGILSTRYSGVASTSEGVLPKHEQFTVTRNPRDFCESSIISYSRQSAICSTSWATAAVEIAEFALNNEIQLSVDQLLHCLPKDEDINGCQGVHPKTLSFYLYEVGLVKKEDFTNCASLENQKRYRFKTIYPEAATGGGLMNLVASNKPVFVLVALDLVKLRFVKDMSQWPAPLKCGGYEPSIYGIVSGYKYDEDNIENSYWEMSSHLVGCEEITLRLPLTANLTNANYAGIAAYSFTLKLAEVVEPDESTADVTDVPTTSEPIATSSEPIVDAPSQMVLDSPGENHIEEYTDSFDTDPMDD